MKHRPVYLPILHNTEEKYTASLIGKEVDYKDYETREILFLDIAAVAPLWQNHKDTGMSEIFCCGTNFLCTLSPKEVAALILSEI